MSIEARHLDTGDSDLRGAGGHASKLSPVPPPSPQLPDESIVLVAAAASARESRKSFSGTREEFAERRRKAHSIAATRLANDTSRPTLRHATSAYTIYETPGASSSKTTVSVPSTPTPSTTFEDLRPKRSSMRKTLLQSKRSLPQLHNVWESFLQETSEDVIFGDSTEIDRQDSGSSRKTVRKGADLSLHASRKNWRPIESHPPLPCHIPTSSASSKLTVSTVASSMMSPIHSPSDSSDSISTASPCKSSDKSAISSVYPPPSRMTMLQRRSRIQGRGRGSVQTTTSSLEATTSSMSSLGFSSAGFSSMSSITSVESDEPESGKERTNDPEGRHSRGETQASEVNQTVDFSSSKRTQSPHTYISSGSISTHQSHFRDPISTTPHTPSQTPNTTTTSLPPTPPLSRSSSQSRSPRSRPKHSGQPSPNSSVPSTPFSNSHANVQWRGASPSTLLDCYSSSSQDPYGNFNSTTHVSGSLKSSNFTSGLIRVPSSSESSDACSTGEDVLSELEYYIPRRRSPSSRQHPGLPPSPAPIQPNWQHLAKPAVPRSKSASNIRLVAKSAHEGPYGAAPSRMGLLPSPALSSSTSASRPSPENMLRLLVNPPRSSSNKSSASRTHRRSGSNETMHMSFESYSRSTKATLFPSQSLPPSPLPNSSFPPLVKNGAGPRSSGSSTSSSRDDCDLPGSTSSSIHLRPPSPPSVPTYSDVFVSNRLRSGPSVEQRPASRPGTASSANVQWGYAL